MSTSMRTYVIRRLLLMIPVLIGVTLLIFAITQLFDPYMRASLYIRDPRQARNIESIIRKYGLDQPMYIQYFRWLDQVLHGNLGWSQSIHMPVLNALLSHFPATAELALYAAPLTIIIGILLGKLAAVKKDTAIDHVTRIMAIIGWSLPSFWLGIMLLAVFYGGLGIFSPG
ncbi:MAG: ABC transporter permease, partial [Thaumarchaeota archaeon]|nr:ABC transporter permease [Nitrososphaerota archaeon]